MIGMRNWGAKRQRRPGRCPRHVKQAVATVLFLTSLLVTGVHLSLSASIDAAIVRDAETRAERWALFFNSQIPNLGGLISSGEPTLRQRDIIWSAVSYGEVYRFTLFDKTGRPVVMSDTVGLRHGGSTEVNALAAEIYRTRRSDIALREGGGTSEEPAVYVQAYVPAQNAEGTVFGVIGVYLDRSAAHANYHGTFQRIAYGLPLLSALIYLVPSLAFLAKSEQARRRQENVEQLSHYDMLTGVLNRRAMTAHGQALFDGRGRWEHIGVLAVDVDRFKSVNDTFGHRIGDQFLRFVGDVISETVRAEDIVARISGDEFVVLLPRITQSDLERIAGRILSKARKPFEYEEITVRRQVSIGMHWSPPPQGLDAAIRAADVAVYNAKITGRDRAVMYEPALDKARLRQHAVADALQGGWEAGRLTVHFQPLIDARDQSVVGFEALLRLRSADGEMISPDEFVPVAEELGLVGEIGAWTLREAIATAKTWPEDLFVSVNLSPAQFLTGDLVETVRAALEELAFPGHRLELELTESLLLEDEQRVAEQLVNLKELGVSIAMDDFGTGYSSLGYLWKYCFDKLKVDRVFLEGYEFDKAKHRDIIETIVVLGHKMGMKVTVEGVENKMQTDMLGALNCDQFQGYLFGRPVPGDATLEVIARAGAAPMAQVGRLKQG